MTIYYLGHQALVGNMLLNLHEIFDKYRPIISGLVVVGTHEAEEIAVYRELGIKNICWIEGNPQLIPFIKMKVGKDLVLNEIVAEQDGKDYNFHITNNFASSSILPLDLHKTIHPEVYEEKIVQVKAKTLDTIVKENNIEHYNFLSIDVQGAEDKVLEGAKKYLDSVDYIMTEVNFAEMYKGCKNIKHIDEILSKFERVSTSIFGSPPLWGDAFYIRKL